MAETLETLANRINRLEATVQQLVDRVSRPTSESTEPQEELDNFKTSAELLAYY